MTTETNWQAPAIKIQPGKFYKTRTGETKGPMRSYRAIQTTDGDLVWYSNGTFSESNVMRHKLDLIEEVVGLLPSKTTTIVYLDPTTGGFTTTKPNVEPYRLVRVRIIPLEYI